MADLGPLYLVLDLMKTFYEPNVFTSSSDNIIAIAKRSCVDYADPRGFYMSLQESHRLRRHVNIIRRDIIPNVVAVVLALRIRRNVIGVVDDFLMQFDALQRTNVGANVCRLVVLRRLECYSYAHSFAFNA